MGKINILDISVANLIAAGEVVDRPASAIKELVENAIDAGATAVTVEIARGGVSLMRVTDNGCGMSGEDAVASLRRHATSKIQNAEDLASIMTLGFRGEALAAITAVTEFRILTKRAEDAVGTSVSGKYGVVSEIAEAGCPDGTTIVLEHLFSTTPARLKFLKSDTSEGTAVLQAVEKLAVSHPEIAFRFVSDGNLKFATMGDGNLKNAIYAAFGGAFATKLLPVSGEFGGIGVSGFLSAPDAPRGNRTMEHFFINKRCVRSRSLSSALEAAYRSFIPSDKFPACVLDIAIPPERVDVNIHPAKLEVKFSDEKAVFDALYAAVRKTLQTGTARPELTFSGHGTLTEKPIEMPKAAEKTALDILFEKASERGAEQELPKRQKVLELLPDDDEVSIDVPPVTEKPAGQLKMRSEGSFEGFSLRERLYGGASDSVEEVKIPPVKVNTDASLGGEAPREIPEFRIVGEVFSCYVLLEVGEKMILFDKHAAHERINYEKMRASLTDKKKNSRVLLAPIPLSLSDIEGQTAKEYAEELCAVGFELSNEDGKATLSAVPEDMEPAEARKFFMTLLSELQENGEISSLRRQGRFERSLYQSACKASVKGGRVYDMAHIRWIAENLLRYDCIKFCPHGRPVAFEISKKELESRFGRT